MSRDFYFSLILVGFFTGCASMEGYRPNPNDTPVQGLMRFTRVLVNAANQSITGYTNNVMAVTQVVEQNKSPVVIDQTSTPSESSVVDMTQQVSLNVNATNSPRPKVVKKSDELETIVVPTEYVPAQSFDPNLVIVIQP